MDKHNRQARKATRFLVTLDQMYPDKTTGELVTLVDLMTPIPGSATNEEIWWVALANTVDPHPDGGITPAPSPETISLIRAMLLARY